MRKKQQSYEQTVKIDAKVRKQQSNPLFLKAREKSNNEIANNYLNIGNIFDQDSCNFCGAHSWPSESQTICCSQGKILESVQSYRKPPDVLCNLLREKSFCDKIKEYNNSLALASLGHDQSPEAGPNFKILGKMYHKIGSIGKPQDDTPKFAQLYFYDQERETENRLEHQTKKLKPEIIKILQSMLKENNPYIKSIKSAEP